MAKPRISSETIIAAAKKSIPELRLLYLFGSVAAEQETEESDLDLGFVSGISVSDLRRWEIQNELANNFDCDVDLVDLHSTTDVLRYEVITKGRVIFGLNEEERHQFEVRSLRDYLQLNELRADIIREFMDVKDGSR